jgi:hypothetical protein
MKLQVDPKSSSHPKAQIPIAEPFIFPFHATWFYILAGLPAIHNE